MLVYQRVLTVFGTCFFVLETHVQCILEGPSFNKFLTHRKIGIEAENRFPSQEMKKHRHKMPQVICFEDDPINIALLGTVSLIVAQCFL